MLLAVTACSDGESQALSEAQRRLDRGVVEIAEAALSGVVGPRAEQLRAQAALVRHRREQLEQAIGRVFAQALEHEPNWARVELQGLLASESDPSSVVRLEQALSDLATYLAERRSARTGALGGAIGIASPLSESNSHVGEPASVGEPSAGDALAQARASQASRQWSAALARLDRAVQDQRLAPEVELARQSIRSEARVDAEAVLSRAKELERSAGAATAARQLGSELARFPDGKDFESLRFEARLLAERALHSSGAPAQVASNSSAPLRDVQLSGAASADECVALAMSRTSAGELAAARAAWIEAGKRYDSFEWRQECDARARELDYRIAMREELVDFARIDAPLATALAADLSNRPGQLPSLSSFRPAELGHWLERARASNKARMGWVIESIERGETAEREAALLELGSAWQRGDVDSARASGLVARARGAVDDRGWAFQGGRWMPVRLAQEEATAASAAEHAAEQHRLVGRFVRSENAQRDELFAELLATGDTDLLSSALTKRWEAELEKFERSPLLRQLGALADERRRLDSARTQALGLIFDEVRYFYPYNPPECPPEKAAKYAGVQREVDVLVGAVREIWEGSRRVKLGEGLRQQLANLAWTRACARDAMLDLPAFPIETKFVLSLPAGDEVGLPEFAWDATERAAIDQSVRIEARNERLWFALERSKPADDVPGEDERRQVRITNAYRRMLGRSALAWNPKIEAAAQGHSNYMANSGNFGHFEKGDPTRLSPMDRMRAVGYTVGVSENISMGRSDPQSAHEGWTHSSGHHRNLLMPDHREMASAIAANYWTQNFGMDSSFLADL